MPQIPLFEDRWYERQRFPAGPAVEVPQDLFDLISLERAHQRTNGRAALAAAHGTELADALQAAGFVDMDAVARADDTALLALPKVGRATLRKLKPQTAAEPDDAQPE